MAIVNGTLKGETIDSADGVTSGIDQIFAHEGNDKIFGLGGMDFIWGGAGADQIDGGSGRDYACYNDSPAGVKVNLQTGKGSGGDAQGDTLFDIQNLWGSQHNDTLIGDGNDNELSGFDGNDLLKGFGGSDILQGYQGHDQLFGLDGNDYLLGDEGNDILYGGAGRDELTGGIEADIFAWYDTTDTDDTEGAADVIVDFNFAEGDRIDLASIDADIYALGNQAFTFIGLEAFTLNTATPENSDVIPGEINYYHSGGNTYIQLQTGQSADVEAVIRINGIVDPQASWFVL
jgi:serralysin